MKQISKKDNEKKRLITLLITVLLSVLIVITLTRLLVSKYPDTPPLASSGNYKTIHLTKTKAPLDTIKYYMGAYDFEAICQFKLLGWDSQNNFYYKRNCPALTTHYKYDVVTGQKKVILFYPELSVGVDSYNDEQIITLANLQNPKNSRSDTILIEPSTYLVKDSSICIDETCSQIALITKRIYSVYDVLLLIDEE